VEPDYNPAMSLNHELSDLFARFASIMELKGESVFKAIAFSKVSRLLKDMTTDIRSAFDAGKLDDIEGIGASSKKIIADYIRTGSSPDFDEVAASVPAGLIPMLEIPGLGPKTIALLWKEKGITSLDELTKAIDAGALAGMKGIGQKKIDAIKQGIELKAKSAGRIGIAEALPIAAEMLARLKALKQVNQAEIAGSLRRRKETIGDVDFVCSLSRDDIPGEEVTAEFVKFPGIDRVLGQGTTKASVLTKTGLQVDLRIVPAENFGAALLYFTGSKEHGVKIRGRALDMGMTLNEWGIYKLADHEKAAKKTGHAPELKPLASKSEADVYKKLGLEFIEPELREDRGEVEAAAAGTLPDLIEISDIRGDLHTHTTASDGSNSIDEMIEAAIAKGYQFYGISDHSKSQVLAHGLTVDRLLAHIKAIHSAAEKYKKQIKVLAGCEVDILVDGSLDYEDSVLAELDYVVASPHVSLKQDDRKATDRLRRAIDHKYVTIVGHPTGRLINSRAGLPLRFDELLPAAAAAGTAMEINAGYPRLDLDDIHARAAINAGVMLSINTDAHSIEGLGGMMYGIDVARRAWATKKNVINCMSVPQLEKFIAAKK
jgi:DNA polymerase (family 10)